MPTLGQFLGAATMQSHPLRALQEFLSREDAVVAGKMYEQMRFVGYVLDIGYDEAVIITSDPFKLAVGGVPRGSILVMVPDDFTGLPLHCTLLRVADAAPTPLSSAVAQTYFELQKKSMPEIDVFTQSELQWGALRTTVLGMLYADPDRVNRIEFSGDVNNFVSAHRYRVYAPDASLQDLIVNALIDPDTRFQLGELRLTECRLDRLMPQQTGANSAPTVPVYISSADFLGTRTAMFGKTRLGKSNIVKLLAENSIVATTSPSHGAKTVLPPNSVGQLIFDQNGEYSNDNPQDDNLSLASKYKTRCHVYALIPKKETPSKPLKLNFYEQPDSSHAVLTSLLESDGRDSGYVNAFTSVAIPEIGSIATLPIKEQVRPRRKIQMYWALLHAAAFEADEKRLRTVPSIGFDPAFAAATRAAVYGKAIPVPPPPSTLTELLSELQAFARANRQNTLQSTSGGNLFDPNDTAILEFLEPQSGRSGVTFIMPYRKYHHPQAGDFVTEITKLLDGGETVLLDLGNANEAIMRYFSDMLTRAVFASQVTKFTSNKLEDHFIQIYFEEAHNLFPRSDADLTKVYSRLAKEGAKYHIGMVYSTQSPTTISRDLLKNTENFFITHLSAHEDVQALADLNIAYEPVKDEILHSRTPGYVRMLTRSHRFVIAAQARRFETTPSTTVDSTADKST